jgi:hypothetical protein
MSPSDDSLGPVDELPCLTKRRCELLMADVDEPVVGGVLERDQGTQSVCGLPAIRSDLGKERLGIVVVLRAGSAPQRGATRSVGRCDASEDCQRSRNAVRFFDGLAGDQLCDLEEFLGVSESSPGLGASATLLTGNGAHLAPPSTFSTG